MLIIASCQAAKVPPYLRFDGEGRLDCIVTRLGRSSLTRILKPPIPMRARTVFLDIA